MQGVAGQQWLAVTGLQAVTAAAVLGVGRHESRMRGIFPIVVSAAVGVLLAMGAGHLLPEGLHALGNRPAVWLALGGTMFALWSLERIVHRVSGVAAEPSPDLATQDCEEIHSHGHSHAASRPSSLLLGSFTHSFVDGASIAAAFVVSPRLGWVTAFAVALHEVPHRLGDFALLLHMEMRSTRAAWLAIVAGAASFLGLGLVQLLGDTAPGLVAWLLPVSAGSFLYISLADLLPEMLRGTTPRERAVRLFALAAGAALALTLGSIPGA